jgi:S-methylmethionine-dependent homocysteine/selenocysteine methylase
MEQGGDYNSADWTATYAADTSGVKNHKSRGAISQAYALEAEGYAMAQAAAAAVGKASAIDAALGGHASAMSKAYGKD